MGCTPSGYKRQRGRYVDLLVAEIYSTMLPIIDDRSSDDMIINAQKRLKMLIDRETVYPIEESQKGCKE